MFNSLAGLDVATAGLKGDVTPASLIAAVKSMPWSVLPGSGGLHFRCNGKADPAHPAICSNALLAGKLNSQGRATSYTPVGDAQIPD